MTGPLPLVFTRPPDALMARGTDQFLAGLDGVIVPWQQAVQQKFDLAIAASSGHLDVVRAPVLALSHGIGFSKLNVRYPGFGAEAPLEVAGMERAALTFHGRVIPSAIVVPTERALKMLTGALPEAASAAIVGGDPAYDHAARGIPPWRLPRRRRRAAPAQTGHGAGSL